MVTTTATNQRSNESTDSLLLAPPPDPPKNLPPISSRKTENATYSDTGIDASNSSGNQNSAIPPDPAMTRLYFPAEQRNFEKGIIRPEIMKMFLAR